METKKAIKASLPAILLSLFLLGVAIFLHLSVGIIGNSDPNSQLLKTITIAYSYLLFPLFAGVYFWTGKKATRKHGLDPMSAGFAGAFAFFVTGIAKIGIDMILTLLAVKGYANMPTFKPIETVLSATLFGSNFGIKGIGTMALCGAGFIILGAMLCFIISSAGSMMTRPKRLGQF